MPDLLTIALVLLALTAGCFAVALYWANRRLRAEAKRAAGEYVSLLAAHDGVVAQLRATDAMLEGMDFANQENRRAINQLSTSLADLRRIAYVREGNAFKRVTPVVMVAAK